MPSIDIGGRSIQYAVVKGESRRYTYFRFRPDMTLEVILPRKRGADVRTAIQARTGWISREYDRMAGAKRILGPDDVMFDGARLKISFERSTEEALVPDPAAGVVTVRARERRAVKELVRRWFLRETSSYVVGEANELSRKLGVKPSRVDVREISRWGYCTRGGRLSFSWQLIALPKKLREYVVLHELTHLSEFNHSRAFKRRLESVCPDFRERERELDGILPYDHMTVM